MNRTASNHTAQELDEALAFLAKVVLMHGDTYFPIFERLEKERDKLHGRGARLAEALNRVKKAPEKTAIQSSAALPA